MSPRRPRKVLHMVLDLNEGGLERVVTDLVLAGGRERSDASVLCLREPGRLADELPAGKVHRVARGRGMSMAYPSAIAARIRDVAPDVLHLHSGVWLKGAYAGRLAGVPKVVFTDHGRLFPDPMGSQLSDRLGAVATDAVVAVSKPLAEYLSSRLRISLRRLRVVPNGIRIPAIAGADERARLRAELGLPPAGLIAGSVGRFDTVKAYDLLIAAMALVRSRWSGDDKPLLALIGDGPERPALAAQAAALGLQDSVRFLGWRRDAQRVLPALDLFVLSSDSEGTSISLVEAMAAERPVIATRVGGTPDVLGADLAGQLVESRNVEALAQRIERTLLDPGLRADLGRRGRRRVVDRYAVTTMADAYESLYDELSRNGSGEAHPPGSQSAITSGYRYDQSDGPPRSFFKRIVARSITNDYLLRLSSPLRRPVASMFLMHRFAMPDLGVAGHDPDRLRKHLAYLRKHRYNLISVAQLVEAITERRPLTANTVVFTVDDGYSDFYDVAVPIFAEFDCPVTVFLITDFIAGAMWNWWDRVEFAAIRSSRGEARVELAGDTFILAPEPWQRGPVIERIIERLKRLPDPAKERAIAALAAQLDVALPERAPDGYRAMSWDQVRACPRPLVTFGPHSVTHPILSMVDDARAKVELWQSWQALSAETPAAIPVFCYPNGQAGDFLGRDKVLAAGAGMTAAICCKSGYAHADAVSAQGCDLFELPRFVYPEWTADFIQIVSGTEHLKDSLRK